MQVAGAGQPVGVEAVLPPLGGLGAPRLVRVAGGLSALAVEGV